MNLYLLPSVEQQPPPAADLLWNFFHVGSLAVFVFMSIVPTEALAYAQYVSTSQGPLLFVRDDTVAGDALSSHDFPRRAAAMQTVNTADIAEGATVKVLAFAYSSSASQTDSDPFTTATGQQAGAGTLAANWLPFGTRVRVGDTMYTVEDRMNARYDEKYVIDLWQSSAAAAVEWGARMVDVEIVSLP